MVLGLVLGFFLELSEWDSTGEMIQAAQSYSNAQGWALLGLCWAFYQYGRGRGGGRGQN